MIFPTLSVQVLKKVGTDAYAQPRYAATLHEKVAPVKLGFMQRPTSVRTDVAASKARALEHNANVVVLARPTTRIALDDKLVVMGHSLRVVDVQPRISVTGELDHYQIGCEAWS